MEDTDLNAAVARVDQNRATLSLWKMNKEGFSQKAKSCNFPHKRCTAEPLHWTGGRIAHPSPTFNLKEASRCWHLQKLAVTLLDGLSLVGFQLIDWLIDLMFFICFIFKVYPVVLASGQLVMKFLTTIGLGSFPSARLINRPDWNILYKWWVVFKMYFFNNDFIVCWPLHKSLHWLTFIFHYSLTP